MLLDLIAKAQDKFFRKISAYYEAYIFVLEAEQLALAKLKTETPEDPYRTIQASYVRFHAILSDSDMVPNEYYRATLFTDLISSTEVFFSELLKAVFCEYPAKIGSSKVELHELINGESVEAIIEKKAEEEIYKLMYAKPEDYLNRLCSLLAIDEEKLKPYWPIYIEAKARRDLGVHNDWICNDTYLRKTRKLGLKIESKIGERLLPLDAKYCNPVGDGLAAMANEIGIMMSEKYS